VTAAGELAEVADRLYNLRPDAFTEARDEEVKRAKAAGNAELAREIGKLRKPTQSAWLINLLWRDQREVMEQLFELAAELGRATAEASGSALRELTVRRHHIENALLRRARELAKEAGVDVGPATEREAQETLAAALADPRVAEEVRTGQLVKPAEYAGFGVAPTVQPARPAREAPAPIDDFQARAAERERKKRAEAEERVQRAREALDVANAQVASRVRGVEAANTALDRLSERIRDLESELRRAEQERSAARRSVHEAEQHQQTAERARDSAQEVFDRASRALDDLR
jgi:hypothetical protein